MISTKIRRPPYPPLGIQFYISMVTMDKIRSIAVYERAAVRKRFENLYIQYCLLSYDFNSPGHALISMP